MDTLFGSFVASAPIMLFVLIAGLVVGIAVWSYRRNQARIASLAGLAASRGWTYSPVDPFGLPTRWEGPPFHEGYDRVASNVITGAVRGRPMVAFDYEYKEDSTDNEGNRRTNTYHFAVCALRMPAYMPALSVLPETMLTRLGQALGASDIELESEDFNRRYRVKCPQPKFASDVLTPRTMEALLACEPFRFRFAGQDLLCWDSGRSTPVRIIERTETMSRVLDGVPTFVWRDHGYDPQAQTSG